MFGLLSLPLIILTHEILPGETGAIEGFVRPLITVQHLLAMIAIGVLAAKIGGRAIWTVPLTFIGVLIIGSVAGAAGGANDLVQYGVAISLLLLGLGLLIQQRIPEALALVIAVVFALFHGYAHGEAIRPEQTVVFLVAYILGFLMSTAGLQVIGTLVGFIALRSPRGTLFLRFSGGMIALVGVFFLLGA